MREKEKEGYNIWLVQRNEGGCNTALMSGLNICSSSPLYTELHTCTLSHRFTQPDTFLLFLTF